VFGVAGCLGPSHPTIDAAREPWSYGPFAGHRLTTPHYQIFTTVRDPVMLDAIPKVLEGAYAEYRRLIPGDEFSGTPMQTYLFADRGQWEAYTKKATGARAPTYLKIRSGGYEENGVTISHYSRRGTTLSVLAHEGLHQYLTRSGRREVPAWLNEGLATQFEAFDLDGNGWPVFDPRRNTMRCQHLRDALKHDRLYKLGELLSLDAGAAIRAGEERSRTFYGQVWALTLFLRDPPAATRDAPGFRRLLAGMGTPEMREEVGRYRSALLAVDNSPMTFEEAAFRYYIAGDLDEFAARYEAFARKLVGL
jgi:hypothetical protein